MRRYSMSERGKRVAEILLDIGAVFLRPEEPFTWASGIKSPIYCDNRLLLSYVDERREVQDFLAEMVKEKFPNCEAVMGTSTAGIPHAAFLAERLNLPMGYVRASAKDHGRNKQIEGKVAAKQKVVVVEDLISTGSSVLEVVRILKEAGAEVLAVVSIFTYGMEKAKKAFDSEDVRLESLSNFDLALDVAVKKAYIKESDRQALLKFRENPSDESWIELR